jgi:hypothetical protein
MTGQEKDDILIQVTAKWGDHIGRFDYINTEHAANAYWKP